MMFVWADRCTANGECSDAMNYLTGGLVASYPTSDEKRAWDALQTCISGGAFASSSSRAIHSEAALREVGLVQGHAYSILHAIETSGKLRLVNLKNPCKQPNDSLSLVGCPPASGASRGFVVAHKGGRSSGRETTAIRAGCGRRLCGQRWTPGRCSRPRAVAVPSSRPPARSLRTTAPSG